MNIIAVASEEQRIEISRSEKVCNPADWRFFPDAVDVDFSNCDAIFWLNDQLPVEDLPVNIEVPVFANAVSDCLSDVKIPGRLSRINGWPGFLQRKLYEVATTDIAGVTKIFSQLGWQFIQVKDEPGFVSARVVSMIINEAYFALEDGISSKEEIDLAMKFGTNYPFGPFEWAEKIGLDKILQLLKKLSVSDKRFLPCQLLEDTVKKFAL